MAQFTDCLNRTWTLRLTLGHRARLKDLGVNPANFGTAVGTIAQLTAFDADVLATLCHALTVEPVTPAEYADGFDEATILAAGEALADAVADFYLSRQPRLKAAAKRAVAGILEDLDAKAAEALTRSASATS